MNIDINCPSQRILLGWGIILSVPGFYAYAIDTERAVDQVLTMSGKEVHEQIVNSILVY